MAAGIGSPSRLLPARQRTLRTSHLRRGPMASHRHARTIGKSLRQTSVLQRIGIGLVVQAVVFAAVAAGMSAGATPGVTPALITDYANYPQASIVPNGCAANGGVNILQGVSYTVVRAAGGTQTSTELRSFEAGGLGRLLPGDVVHMTWTGLLAGCEGAGISLSFKRTPSATF